MNQKINNLVAKNNRHVAATHKTEKDYDRRDAKSRLVDEVEEALDEYENLGRSIDLYV